LITLRPPAISAKGQFTKDIAMTSQFSPKAFVQPPRLWLFDLPANSGSVFYRLMLRREQLRAIRRLQALPPHLLADVGFTPQSLAALRQRIVTTRLYLGTPLVRRAGGAA
jgi:hypothetical protein